MKAFLVYNQLVTVDDDDFYRVKDRKWCLNKGKFNNGYYAMYGVRNGNKVRKVYLHRLISGADQGDRIEFVNGNTLDCQKKNLRKNGKRIA